MIDEASLSRLSERVRQIVKFSRSKGIREVYFYAVDELKGNDLIIERPMLKAIKGADAKTFVACEADFMGKIEDLLDLPILHGPPAASLVKANKGKGNKMWIYGYPQAGREEPETYRRNYGLMLLKWGLDGTCNYAYQCDMGQNIWNDFDSDRYRDHVMAYPTIKGIIPTVQWEGWRAGVNDVRYFSTLLNHINQYTPNLKEKRQDEINKIIQNVDESTNLYGISSEIINKLLSCSGPPKSKDGKMDRESSVAR
jgi:hypothetical protein